MATVEPAPASTSAPSRATAHLLLQTTVLLWGATAVLGHAISIRAIPLVWYRLALTVPLAIALVVSRGLSLRVPRARAWRYAVTGACIGLHWVCFYAAIKQAGIATAVITLSTNTFWTSLIEPVAFRRRVAAAELAIGAAVVVGTILLAQYELRADPLGMALGFSSAILASTFGVFNGKLARGEHPARLLAYEMSAALLVVSVAFVAVPAVPTAADVGWLAILAVFCTVIPQLLSLVVLRTLSPFSVALAVNLEPVYALVMAALVFPDSEALSLRFYLGAALLLGLLLANAARARAVAGAPAPTR